MELDRVPVKTVGPIASAYVLPRVSVTELMVPVPSLQPTATTIKLPAVWAPMNVAEMLDCGEPDAFDMLCT